MLNEYEITYYSATGEPVEEKIKAGSFKASQLGVTFYNEDGRSQAFYSSVISIKPL